MQKKDLYKGIRTVGFVSFIPFILAAGPLSGYFVGDFLQKRYNLSYLVVLFGVVFGFLAAAVEIARILKALNRADKR